MRISVLVACFNRKEATRKCLETLSKQLDEREDCLFEIYVYDDGSTDGTYEMLKNDFKNLVVKRGDGKTYWCKSMFFLMELAAERKYDFYLMVNDDVQFEDNFLSKMLDSYKKANCSCGIVGATRSANKGNTTYGGHDLNKTIMSPNGDLQRCFWANWNCFLIDQEVLNRVGLIDGKYQHAWGDFDYSNRMRRQGIPIYLATDYVGECEYNSTKGTYMDNELSRCERLRKLCSPKGLPLYSFFRYNTKVEGIKGVFKTLYGYASIVGYILLNRKID